MASTLLQLYTARLQTVTEEIAAITASSAGGKPNAPGKNVDHVGYLRSLEAHSDWLRAQISICSGGASASTYGSV